MQHRSLNGIGMALAAAMLWGTTGTAQSLAPDALSAHWVGALRLLVASLFFAALVAWIGRREAVMAELRALPWRWVLVGGVCMAAYNLSFFTGVKLSGVAVGTAVAIGSGPIWAGLLQWLVQRQSPAAVWWAGTLLAVAGGALLVSDGGGALAASVTGLLLCLTAGLSYAVYVLVNKRLVGGASPAVVTFGVFSSAALLALPLAALLAGPLHASADSAWLALYLGIVPTGIAYLLFSSALRHLSGATGVTLALGEPVTAFALALLVVGERPALPAFVGLTLVLYGLALVIRAELRAPAPAMPVHP